MYACIVRLITRTGPDLVDKMFNRIGLSSAAVTVTTATAQASEAAPLIDSAVLYSLSYADLALVVSSIGGVLFIVEKVIVIYIRYRELKRLRSGAEGSAQGSKDPE